MGLSSLSQIVCVCTVALTLRGFRDLISPKWLEEMYCFSLSLLGSPPVQVRTCRLTVCMRAIKAGMLTCLSSWTGLDLVAEGLLCMPGRVCLCLAPDSCCASSLRLFAAIYWPHTSPACIHGTLSYPLEREQQHISSSHQGLIRCLKLLGANALIHIQTICGKWQPHACQPADLEGCI